MILVALGSNLPTPGLTDPRESCEAALDRLSASGVAVSARSRWWRTAPVPISDQPWFCNGVVRVETALPPDALLALLHEIEDGFGRIRRVRNEARVIDLDLLAYDDKVLEGPAGPVLPHPRLQERAFVLLPLAEVAPGWRHPVLDRTVEQMLAALPPGQAAEPMAEDPR
ncbi:2-amino-4-hydroxy-6-hydroxymethyldihydropteridine diphosphokinase [Arenibaculum pallidiluteum]|uniref:2-amino-4-hydroxy-6- hydroxymethyldihydropteridine diphosphokinase n=1 Tax=Arenibaculum pallidiluteum TaxID=2812559 RepID=UPI001A97C41F|nr:2-amino-4-hydroxy-6-hydroxymethyldihydropteridine diphosphokinase [Arenibaculum pallidiluteum]